MKLISKHHDYYDGLVRCTINDPTYVFVRKKEELPCEKYYLHRPDDYEVGKYRYRLYYGLIGFCGTLYPYVNIDKSKVNPHSYARETESFYCYTMDELELIMPMGDMKNYRKSYRSFNVLSNIKSWFAQEDNISYRKKKCKWIHDKLALFENHTMAYFSVEWMDGKFVIYKYPILKDLQFYKVFDCATAFQKIEQYLTNELVKPDKIEIEISDELKRDTHGFDEKSFKKESSK